RKFQERFPCFVEELQSDKLIIYIFGTVLIISGLITPSMYPGDSAWLSLTKTYNNVLVEALLAGHGVAPNYSGYIATEGFGEFFLYLSIITIVLGPKVIFRDHRSATIDMIFAQPLPFNKVVNQRLAAIILEIFTLGLLSITGYVLGTILLNDYYNYIPAIGAGILFIFLITLTMTFINAFIASFLKNTGSALGASTLVYFGLYLTYLIAFTIDPLKTLSKLTPFSWSDRTGILYDQTLHWNDFLAFFGYVSLIALMTFLTLRNIKKKEFLG
ncbi:MAG: ABC transporter permease subunit, partial [Candidatus Hodarchaeota archaeon]